MQLFFKLYELFAALFQTVGYALTGHPFVLRDLRKRQIVIEIQIGDLPLMFGQKRTVDIPQP